MISKILSGTFLAVAALQPAAASRPLTDSLTVASGLLAMESVATPAPVTAQPESETDSIAQLRLRLQRKYIESTLATDGLTVIDTLATVEAVWVDCGSKVITISCSPAGTLRARSR